MGSWKSGISGWAQMVFNFFLVTSVTDEQSTEHSDEIASPLSDDVNTDSLSKVKLPRKLPSIIEIKKKIPKHCFVPDTATSMYYALRDFAGVVALYYIGEYLWNHLSTPALLAVAPLFIFVQGTLFTALFVIGHDCGHGSFSNIRILNEIIGNICHMFLMCPYFTWKLTHKLHHKNTGNMDKDEVFYPVREKDNNGGKVLPGFGLGIGWFGYLVLGYSPRNVPHFDLFHSLFRNHLFGCMISLSLLAFWGSVLYNFAVTAGFLKFCFHYFGPLFVFATNIVVITFLHHHDDDIPWYADHLWSNVRGQLSSVDRDYGIVHGVIHNITTHQIHHLFPKVPHYHLEEATAVFRKEFPELVHYDPSPVFPKYFKMFAKYAKQCIIPDDAEIHIYK